MSTIQEKADAPAARRSLQLEWKLLLASAVLFLLGFAFEGGGDGPWQPSPRQESLLRVATWNVGSSSDAGGKSLRSEHLQHVVAVLRSIDADVVVLQEVRDRAQLQDLLELLPPGASAVHRGGQKVRAVSIVAWRGRLTQVGMGDALVARYDSRTFVPLFVAGVHANPLSSTNRNETLGRLVNNLGHRLGEQPSILAGDLNLDLDLDKRRDLFSDNEYRDVETYNFICDHFQDAAVDAGSTAEPDRRLDYIFVDPQYLEVMQAGPWKKQRTGDMDHDPLIADLRVLVGGS